MTACSRHGHLNFIAPDVGSHNGRGSDSNDRFKECAFGKQWYEEILIAPGPFALPNKSTHPQQPCVFIGDGTFALHKNLLGPHPGRDPADSRRMFNHRLFGATLSVECVHSEYSRTNVVFRIRIFSTGVRFHRLRCERVSHTLVRKGDGHTS